MVKIIQRFLTSSPTRRIAIIALAVLFALGITTAILFRHAIGHSIALHEGESAIADHTVTPIDLNDAIANYGMSASDFDQSFRWQAIPTDFQVFDHVPFQIDGAMFLWGSRFANAGWAEQITNISVNQKFQTLYLLHCAFHISPWRTPVYRVVFHYEDDAVAPVTNTMLYGEDILDWYTGRVRRKQHIIGPRSHHSRLAWVGGAFSPDNKSPLILCLTAINNPVPDLKVTSIDLDSCKGESAACIFGMTFGKAGLMK